MLKVHEMSKAWPPPTPDRRAATKSSIVELGLLSPMLRWKDGKDEWVCIDGATRQDIIAELHAEGIHQAANGHKIVERWEDVPGTEGDALEVCKAMNGADRRHLSASQLAMTDVINYELEQKYAKRAGVEVEKPEGELATSRSSRGGYNRTYWFQCRRIREQAKDLSLKVRDGDLTIPQALEQLAIRQGKAVPKFEGAVPDDAPVLDGLRNVVEGPYREIIATRSKFKALRGALLAVKKEWKALAESKAGAGIEEGTVALLADLAHEVDAGTPFAVCPVCDGDKKSGGMKCAACNAEGYVTKAGWKEVPAKHKTAGAVED